MSYLSLATSPDVSKVGIVLMVRDGMALDFVKMMDEMEDA